LYGNHTLINFEEQRGSVVANFNTDGFEIGRIDDDSNDSELELYLNEEVINDLNINNKSIEKYNKEELENIF